MATLKVWGSDSQADWGYLVTRCQLLRDGAMHNPGECEACDLLMKEAHDDT
jgi:hypothetical protein